ncbi:hypothetical protein WDU94_012334 [Cyamophila willieti]
MPKSKAHLNKQQIENNTSLDKTLELKQRLRSKTNYVSLNRSNISTRQTTSKSSGAKESIKNNTDKQVKKNSDKPSKTNEKKETNKPTKTAKPKTKTNKKSIQVPNSTATAERNDSLKSTKQDAGQSSRHEETTSSTLDKTKLDASRAASLPQSQSTKSTNNNASIYDLAIAGPGSSHDKGEPRFFSHDDWCTMKEGLLNKILEQEIELNQLREKVATYETMLMILNDDKNPYVADKTKVIDKTIPLKPPASKPSEPTTTCHIIGDSHVRGLAPELSTILQKPWRAEDVFIPGVGFHGLANQHTQSPNLVIPTRQDCVVIMCGTNDVCSTDWNTIQPALDFLITKFKECKLLCLVGVPLRYDNKRLNFHIKRFNLKLKYHLKSKLVSSCFLDPTKCIKPNDYRVDGIHLNNTGKSKLCRRIKLLIMEDRYSGSQTSHKIPITVASSRSPTSSENWLLSEPIRDDPAPNQDTSVFICEDLIDLTEPLEPNNKTFEISHFSDVMKNTTLFPDTSVNDDIVDILSTESVCKTPYTSSNNNYYRLTQVSFADQTFASPLHTNIGNQQNPGFPKLSQPSKLV